MSSATSSLPRGHAAALVVTALVSALLHGAAFAAAGRLGPPPAPPRTLELDVEIAEAPPPPPPPAPAEPIPPPRPPRPRVAAVRRAPEPPPPPDAPPPPNEGRPPEAPHPRAVPRVGVSLSSTTQAGTFAVGVGNTLHGKAPEEAVAPSDVKPYAAERYAPPTSLSAQPRPLDLPPIAYPPAARKAAVEGRVVLLLRLDATGRVASARVVEEPGAGLGEAARAGALRFRFTPAMEAGEPVATEIRFTYTFVLE